MFRLTARFETTLHDLLISFNLYQQLLVGGIGLVSLSFFFCETVSSGILFAVISLEGRSGPINFFFTSVIPGALYSRLKSAVLFSLDVAQESRLSFHENSLMPIADFYAAPNPEHWQAGCSNPGCSLQTARECAPVRVRTSTQKATPALL